MTVDKIRIRSSRDEGCDLHLCNESYCYIYEEREGAKTNE